MNPKRRKLFLQVASVTSANLLTSLGCSKQTLSPDWEERLAKFRGTILKSMQENKVPLGWKIDQTDEFGEFISHGGDQAGFHSLAKFSRTRKSGYVILTNGDKGWKLIQDVAPEMAKWIHA